jgi:Zn-dependent protease
MFLFPTAIALFIHQIGARSAPALFACATFAGLLSAGLLFTMACWTTRNPSAIRSPWAIAACLVDIAAGLFVFRFARHITLASPEPLLIAAGIAGLIVFSRRDTVSAPPVAPAKPAPVPGDRTSPWFDRAATLLFILATWKVISLWSPWARIHHLPTVSGMLWLLLIALVTLVTAVLHEGGHALVARAFRMHLLSFNAGPFQWRKQAGKWTLRFKTSAVIGGNVHVQPTHPGQPAWHDICMVAAGPMVNICTGPLFLWAALHAQGAPWQPAWFFLALMASFSFLAAAFNLLPFRSATGSYSDGARILQLLTNSPVVELQRATRRLQPAEG